MNGFGSRRLSATMTTAAAVSLGARKTNDIFVLRRETDEKKKINEINKN